MLNKNTSEDFLITSRRLGRNNIYVQGAGGNSSMKINGLLLIKASGYRLTDMNTTQGIVYCAYAPIMKFITQIGKHGNENEYISCIEKNTLKNKSFSKPSMEIGFHAIIASCFVFHLHSVYINIFTCMKNGEKLLHEIFPNTPFLFLNYFSPGLELATKISSLQDIPHVIFLKNHGIIIHGNDLNQCTALIAILHDKAEAYLKSKGCFTPFMVKENYNIMRRFIFPDSAVFSNIPFDKDNKTKSDYFMEIRSAQDYIISSILQLNQKPSYLTLQEVSQLCGMQQEKHRLSLVNS